MKFFQKGSVSVLGILGVLALVGVVGVTGYYLQNQRTSTKTEAANNDKQADLGLSVSTGPLIVSWTKSDPQGSFIITVRKPDGSVVPGTRTSVANGSSQSLDMSLVQLTDGNYLVRLRYIPQSGSILYDEEPFAVGQVSETAINIPNSGFEQIGKTNTIPSFNYPKDWIVVPTKKSVVKKEVWQPPLIVSSGVFGNFVVSPGFEGSNYALKLINFYDGLNSNNVIIKGSNDAWRKYYAYSENKFPLQPGNYTLTVQMKPYLNAPSAWCAVSGFRKETWHDDGTSLKVFSGNDWQTCVLNFSVSPENSKITKYVVVLAPKSQENFSGALFDNVSLVKND